MPTRRGSPSIPRHRVSDHAPRKNAQTNVPPQSTTRVTKVGSRRINFRGILGRQTTLIADIYRWQFGWTTADKSIIVYSAEIPDDRLSIDGMLLGRDTIYKNRWGLAYEEEGHYVTPYVPTPSGPVHLVSHQGTRLRLETPLEGTDLQAQILSAHNRFKDVNPNECLLTVSTDYNLKKGIAMPVPVHITNHDGEDVIFQQPTLMKLEGSVKLALEHGVSVENEAACFDEEITTLTMSSVEHDVTLPQNVICCSSRETPMESWRLRHTLYDSVNPWRAESGWTMDSCFLLTSANLLTSSSVQFGLPLLIGAQLSGESSDVHSFTKNDGRKWSMKPQL